MVGPSQLALAVALTVMAPGAAPLPGAVPLPLSDEAVRSEVDRLVSAVATARHLTYHGTLPLRVLDRAEAARQAARVTDQADADPAARTEAELLRRLGLTPPTRFDDPFDDQPARAETSPAAAPRFDAVTGRLWVPGFVPLDSQRVALTHEVAHAAADQRFGFRRLMEIAPDGRSRLSGDARRARLALIEGDAMLTGLEVLDPRETFLGPQQLAALAARLRAAAQDPAGEGARGWPAALSTFTHVTGLLFAARARAHHPWSAVDALWTDPPSSTEEILHPEKYESCQGQVAVEPSVLPALPGLGRPGTTDVAGELVVRTWLGTAWAPEVAARAAAGWGGDRVALYGPGPGEPAPDGGAPPAALTWLTIWDDAGEADDFARAARAVLERQAEQDTGEPATETVRPDGVVFSSARGLFGLARRAEVVALLIAAPEGSESALDAMLGAARRPEPSRRAASRPRPAALPGCLRRDRAGGSG